MKLFPLGTFADILCSDQQLRDAWCTDADGIYRWTHQCVMGESGYSCKCPHGFTLDENQRNCSDIDECQSQACEDHLCVNTHGSYRCACKDGFKMVHGKCSDVDECAQQRCDHKCINNIGSFSCYCNEGFVLSVDAHSCVDIDECVSNPCHVTCINTEGSFSCTCPRGFHLEVDGSTCAPDVTESSAASSDEPADEKTQETFTESLTRTTVELQHQSPHTDAPLLDLENVTPCWVKEKSKEAKGEEVVSGCVVKC
uniref:EGF-like domain-containing protein n=1 Tax=Lates calcarifer TaxID=8187 RepID=A0A4W6DIT1_LATCA